MSSSCRLDYMERHYDEQFKIVFAAIRRMHTSDEGDQKLALKQNENKTQRRAHGRPHVLGDVF